MKRIIILFFLCCTIPLIAQHTDPIQEAMANYDYETALSLIAQKKTTPPLLLQKGKALRGLGLTTDFFPLQVAITISRLNIPTIIWQPAN